LPAGRLAHAQLDALLAALAPGGRVLRVRRLSGGISANVHLVRLATLDRGARDLVIIRFDADWHRVWGTLAVTSGRAMAT
jgi:hypothetical protein